MAGTAEGVAGRCAPGLLPLSHGGDLRDRVPGCTRSLGGTARPLLRRQLLRRGPWGRAGEGSCAGAGGFLLTPVSRRLLKFGVCGLAPPLRNHHAIKEFFLEICVPMGSN